MTTETSPVLTRDQRRAQHALRKIREVPQKLRADYKANANSLPATIVMNGLGQACAMLLAGAGRQSEQDSVHRMIYRHLQDWLCQGNDAVYRDAPDLVEAVIGHGQNDYVRAQGEALAYLDWLKKFAQAYLAGEED